MPLGRNERRSKVIYQISNINLYLYYRLVTDLGKCFTDIGTDSDVRAIVLSGSGRMFTAGLDCKLVVN